MAISSSALWWIDYGDDEFAEFHRDTLAWVRGLGLDPDRLAPQAAVIRNGDRYELHVDEIARDESGRGDRYDPIDDDKLLAFRRIVEVAEDSWPARPVEATVA